MGDTRFTTSSSGLQEHGFCRFNVLVAAPLSSRRMASPSCVSEVAARALGLAVVFSVSGCGCKRWTTMAPRWMVLPNGITRLTPCGGSK